MSKPLTALALKYCFTKIKMKIYVPLPMMNYSAPPEKGGGKRKEEKIQEAHRCCSQNTRIHLITFGISMEINFKVIFNTGSVDSVHVK